MSDEAIRSDERIRNIASNLNNLTNEIVKIRNDTTAFRDMVDSEINYALINERKMGPYHYTRHLLNKLQDGRAIADKLENRVERMILELKNVTNTLVRDDYQKGEIEEVEG